MSLAYVLLLIMSVLSVVLYDLRLIVYIRCVYKGCVSDFIDKDIQFCLISLFVNAIFIKIIYYIIKNLI